MTQITKSTRFFINPYQDFTDTNQIISIDRNYWSNYLEETVLHCVKKTKLNDKTLDGGLYVGNLGLVFMIYKVLSNGFCKKYESELKKYMQDSIELNEKYLKKHGDRTMLSSFLLGDCGFYAMASLTNKFLYNSDQNCLKYARHYSEAAKLSEKKDFLPFGGDELFVGRAGVLCGVLLYRNKLGIEVLDEISLFKILDSVVQSGRDYAKKQNFKCPLMYSYYKTDYIGAAHGISSILFMLLCFPKYFNQKPDVEKDVRSCIDFLLSIQTQEGSFPSSMDEIGLEDELVHWCHGAAGVVYCIAKANLVWKDDKYLNSCRLSSDKVWNKGLIKKGPGICHGIAGNGYVHLLLYRLTNEDKYLYRALKFAEFLENQEFKSKARKPDNPFSLYEGLAGTVCFLIDLLNPKNSEFPFFDLFD